MAGEWREVRIEEIAERVAMGPFGSSIKVETFVPEGVPVISGQHLHGFKVDDSVGYNFITPEHAERLKNANVRRGDIIFTHAGNIGQEAYIPDDSKYERYVISQRQFYMRCDRSKVIPEFVVALFKTREGQHKLLADTSQVGVPSIAQPVTYLRMIKIPLPPLTEQRAIAHILGTLDDKIELNRRMSATLEAMAPALFKAWFVDFEPVRPKYRGESATRPYKPLHSGQFAGWLD
jgi:type I restriction enzyme S subunit